MLQFISHYTDRYTYLDGIRMALEGGCRWIQLRMKHATDDEVRPVALQAMQLCKAYGAKLIIDDRVALVKELGADGVHLGKNDMPVAEARKLLGSQFIIGGTANTFEDILLHYKSSADYIGCGPFRFTTTKEKLAPVLGLEGYRSLLEQMREAKIQLPLVAIGGISAEDIPALMRTGVSGIAVSGAVLRAQDPVAEVKQLIKLTQEI
ncbi:MAG: thiamine phosphate synthase [Paludibacteraceae bacterium]|nr:thiamine phosphate synthase [Paludibacteraceae bacterium]